MAKDKFWKRGHKADTSLLMLSHELLFLRVPDTQCGLQDTLLENETQAGACWSMQGGRPCSDVGASSSFGRAAEAIPARVCPRIACGVA